MLEKVGFGRNLVSDGLFLIFVDLTTVTIQWLTYILNSYIKPYSLPYMYCHLFMLLLGVFVSGVCWLILAYLHFEFLYKPIFSSLYVLSAFHVVVSRFGFWGVLVDPSDSFLWFYVLFFKVDYCYCFFCREMVV